MKRKRLRFGRGFRVGILVCEDIWEREPAQAERRILLAAPPKGVTLPSPFRDNTGA